MWKFPNHSGRPQYCRRNFVAPTQGALLMLGLPMSVPKLKMQRTERTYVCPRDPSFWHCMMSVKTTLPDPSVLLTSTESPVGKSNLGLFHPFIVVSSCQDIDMNVTRRLGQGMVRGTDTKLYPVSPLWSMNQACKRLL